MTGKHITIDLTSKAGIEKAISDLTNVKKEIDNQANEFVDRLGTMAQQEASMRYSIAKLNNMSTFTTNSKGTPQGDGRFEATVNYTNVGNAHGKVTSKGTVLFIEFGTGITKADSPEARADITVGGESVKAHGEYGKRNGSKLKGWYFKHIDGTKYHTMGMDAQPVMYDTKKKVKESIGKIAKETFK